MQHRAVATCLVGLLVAPACTNSPEPEVAESADAVKRTAEELLRRAWTGFWTVRTQTAIFGTAQRAQRGQRSDLSELRAWVSGHLTENGVAPADLPGTLDMFAVPGALDAFMPEAFANLERKTSILVGTLPEVERRHLLLRMTATRYQAQAFMLETASRLLLQASREELSLLDGAVEQLILRPLEVTVEEVGRTLRRNPTDEVMRLLWASLRWSDTDPAALGIFLAQPAVRESAVAELTKLAQAMRTAQLLKIQRIMQRPALQLTDTQKLTVVLAPELATLEQLRAAHNHVILGAARQAVKAALGWNKTIAAALAQATIENKPGPDQPEFADEPVTDPWKNLPEEFKRLIRYEEPVPIE